MANLGINDMKLLAKLRNVDGYENMSRQQLERIFAIPSAPKAKWSDEADELERMEAAINKPLSKNTRYEWYDWLISHILVFVKKSTSNVKQNIKKLLETKKR